MIGPEAEPQEVQQIATRSAADFEQPHAGEIQPTQPGEYTGDRALALLYGEQDRGVEGVIAPDVASPSRVSRPDGGGLIGFSGLDPHRALPSVEHVVMRFQRDSRLGATPSRISIAGDNRLRTAMLS
jgi:hypothetical protein